MSKIFHPTLALLLSLSACSEDPSPAVETDATDASTSGTTDTPQTEESTTTDAPPPADETAATAVCGDGQVEGDEQCDDGINDGAYGGCLEDCSAPAGRCGDGVLQAEANEACDNGDGNGSTSCNAWCQVSGTQLGGVALAEPSLDIVPVVATEKAIFVGHDDGRKLWRVRDRGDHLTSESPVEFAAPWQARALADLGDGRIAVAGGDPGDHDLRVIGIDPFAGVSPSWAYGNSQGSVGGISGFLMLDEELWMLGDRSVTGGHQRWVHRIDPYAKTWKPPVMTQWNGSESRLRPHAIVHPETGLIVVFQAKTGLGSGMRISVLDPASGEELSSKQEPDLDNPGPVCLRPNGELAVIARPDSGQWYQQMVGFRLDQSGEVYRGPSQGLDLGPGGTAIYACVSLPDANLLVGLVGGDALVILIEDLLSPAQSVAWHHIGVQIGLDAKDRAIGAAYRDGRFYVALGGQAAGLAAFAR